MPSLLQPTVVHSGTVKTEIEGRGTREKHYYDRNLGGVHGAIQPGQWVYAKPNPQQKHSAWPHCIVEKVSSPRSYTVVTYTPHRKIRRSRVPIRLVAAPPTDAKSYMSWWSYNGHTCLVFFSRAGEVAHFLISPGKSAIRVLHPG